MHELRALRASKLVLAAISLTGLAGCAGGPARWAQTLADRAYCGMPIGEVEKIAGRKAVEQRSADATHFIRDDGGTTSVSLAVDKTGLRRLEIAWTDRALAIVPEHIKTIDVCSGTARTTPTFAEPRSPSQ